MRIEHVATPVAAYLLGSGAIGPITSRCRRPLSSSCHRFFAVYWGLALARVRYALFYALMLLYYIFSTTCSRFFSQFSMLFGSYMRFLA